MYLNVTRHRDEQTDRYGMLLIEEGEDVICENMPANAYRYDGRPEFSASYATPGIVPNALTLLTVQYNSKTKDIHILLALL